MRWTWQWLIACIGLASVGAATVIHVPAEYSTIQAGIDAAVDGDTVLVADGTYTGEGNRDLDFSGVNMVVMSEDGPDATIIDCEGTAQELHRGFYFHNDEDTTSAVHGFTIRNGYAVGQGGGAIRCDGSSPRIEGNLITGNQADGRGGGINCSDGAHPTVVGNTISGNSAYGWGGGAIGCYGASPIIRHNWIRDNTAPQGGGAITCAASSDPVIEGNKIVWNSTSGDGGAISTYSSSSPVISDNRIDLNRADRHGGGIWCESSSPLIVANSMRDNEAAWKGGGIGCDASASPWIEGNAITSNTAMNGGGICCWSNTSATIIGNTITENVINDRSSAGGWGGGISCLGVASGTIESNVIARNTSHWGGGIYVDVSSSLMIRGNTITENSAPNEGGGIRCVSSPSVLIEDNLIARNSCPVWPYGPAAGAGISCRNAAVTIQGNTIIGGVCAWGGGVYCRDSFATIEENTIACNWAHNDAGGIYSTNSHVDIANNTIAGNGAGEYGGGIACDDLSTVTVLNSILWGDSAGIGPDEIYGDESSIGLEYCDVQGGWPGVGNIDVDPMFLLPEKNDLRLRWPSPCIDSGHPELLDPDGTRSDMGAFFFDQDEYITIYLTPDTTEVRAGGELGVRYSLINRWAQPEPLWLLVEAIMPNGNVVNVMGPDPDTLPADTMVQQYHTHAVPAATPGGSYVVRGRVGIPPATLYGQDKFTLVVPEPDSFRVWHVPAECPTIQAAIDSAGPGDTVLVADGIYTGEGNRDLDPRGVNMVVMSENGPEVTIIDCEGSYEDPHRGFFIHYGEDSTCVVQGFTIRNGYVVGSGGAIFCAESSPVIRGNIISDNSVTSSGGGIYFRSIPAICNASPRIIGNIIVGNAAENTGGAIDCHVGSPIIRGNTITGNTAGGGAGGILIWWSCTGSIVGNTIMGNTAGGSGGGILCGVNSYALIEGNIVAENTAAQNGGGIYCVVSSSSTIDGNTVTGNSAASEGGGIYADSTSSAMVFNSILWGDNAATGPEISGTSVTVDYSDVEGGWPGEGNIDADPLFVTGPLGDHYLSQIAAGQPEQSPCVDAGDPDSPVPEGTTRTDGEPDEWPVDMGYHYPLSAGPDE